MSFVCYFNGNVVVIGLLRTKEIVGGVRRDYQCTIYLICYMYLRP